MTTEPKSASARSPTFGSLSIAAPFTGALLILILLWGMPAFPLSFILTLFLIPLSPICGVGFAVVAAIRRERYSAVWLLGLVINLVAVCILIANRNHIIGSFG